MCARVCVIVCACARVCVIVCVCFRIKCARNRGETQEEGWDNWWMDDVNQGQYFSVNQKKTSGLVVCSSRNRVQR